MSVNFCPNCGAKTLSKLEETSWLVIHICTNAGCSVKAYQTVLGDSMGGSNSSTNPLCISYEQQRRLLLAVADSTIQRIPTSLIT